MKAIIIPLNNILLDFEKYDGSTFAERFRKRSPRLMNFMGGNGMLRKRGMLVVYLIAVPAFTLTILYISPSYIFNLIFYGREKAKENSHEIVDKIIKKLENITEKKRKNIFALMQDYRRQGYKLLIYYSPSMIPTDWNKQILFHDKIDRMKQRLKIFHVFQAKTQGEIEDAITVFGIDIKESIFIRDNNIIPVSHKQLNEETLNEIYI